jgi:hypothetical protein
MPRNYHNKGQSDRANGRYEPPHGLLDSALTWSSDGMAEHRAENESYREGYSHTDSQSRD